MFKITNALRNDMQRIGRGAVKMGVSSQTRGDTAELCVFLEKRNAELGAEVERLKAEIEHVRKWFRVDSQTGLAALERVERLEAAVREAAKRCDSIIGADWYQNSELLEISTDLRAALDARSKG